MGALADRFGRKRVLASSILGPICATLWVILVGEWAVFRVPHPVAAVVNLC